MLNKLLIVTLLGISYLCLLNANKHKAFERIGMISSGLGLFLLFMSE